MVKNVIGNRKMENTDPFNPGIYTTTLTVTSGSAAPNGVGDSTKWKFKAFPDSRFQNNGWETVTDRWHIYQADGTTVTSSCHCSKNLSYNRIQQR